ncbi:unnamed protein product, partial [Allacma fusca]
LNQVTRKTKIMDAEDDDELLIAKPEVFLYEIPSDKVKPGTDCDHRAGEWDLANPTWEGKILIYMAGPSCHVQLDDYQGNTCGQAVLAEYPSKSLKLVTDSSRYFTLNVQNLEGISRLVGIGFAKREDSSAIDSALKGYFTALGSRKRKPEEGNAKLTISDASPPKKEKSKVVEIYSQTNDPDYKYIREDSFQCHECPLNFNCPDLMVNHWKKSHKSRNALLKATMCQCRLPFPNIGEKNVHFEKYHRHTQQHTFPCKVCSTPFHSKQEVIEHFQEVHKRDSKDITANFGCSRCNQEFVTRVQLVEHFRHSHKKEAKTTSTAEDSVIDLNTSSSRDNNSSDANSAINKSRKIDPTYPYISGNLFKCHKCAESFEDVSSLTKHWENVHKLKVVHCQCKLVFLSLEQLQAHQKKFHPFVCSVCKGIFEDESGREEHALSVHLHDSFGNNINAFRFRCKPCKECFSCRRDLKFHLKLMHPKPSGSPIKICVRASHKSGKNPKKGSDEEIVFNGGNQTEVTADQATVYD